MCGDCDLLEWERNSGVDVAFLEYCCPVAENVVYGAVYVAFPVKLAEGVDVKGVLMTFEAAPEEG